MLINLTNHPSSYWSNNQIIASEEYGIVVDIPFPDIIPSFGHLEIQQLADKYADKIIRMADDASVTVHVMGEMTFTYALVSRLKAEGITCVASTTERIATEKDGVKTSEFRFVRFREY